MTPLHPRFRAMLLKNRENRRSGLTPAVLQEYETQLNCYFMASSYFYQRNLNQIDADDCGYRINGEYLNILETDERIPEAIVKKLSGLLDHDFIDRQNFQRSISQLLSKAEMATHGDLLAELAKIRHCQVTELAKQRLKTDKIPDSLTKALEAASGRVYCNIAHLEGDLRSRVKEKIPSAAWESLRRAVTDVTCYSEIVRIRNTFMPAYAEVQKQWVGLQKEILSHREYRGGYWGQVGSTFTLLFRSLFKRKDSTGYLNRGTP